jgi:hypothetical protein
MDTLLPSLIAIYVFVNLFSLINDLFNEAVTYQTV